MLFYHNGKLMLLPNINCSILKIAISISVQGCVIAEMALLNPLLEGEDTGDQVAVMVDMFGPPTDEDYEAMGVEDGTFTSALKILTVSFSVFYL